ncbi:LysR family transcriptional regulator [Azospirillum rugosum]|uniref:DNA-binding transcriptional LysR family regulator n=1 Tax=Azospirillum rugosum TaxID=416170 RepID=A0ABS4SUC8_9PROT|nr:LysR family transcriptional regulator [Azospirillum rugosum]MBP2295703.1 DNA-binding transcriptional LysR family regulator [Azospirillum rugosum]MDQ0526766.1 DNA-binding transcriptional LysR family regulator [Azospirillum rugosum]
MDLAGLRVVKAVADTGSVSRAAESLNCVQSNVTARLKRLEEDLGVDLFRRLSRGMAPTPAGRVLADYADRVLRLVAQARDAVADAAGRGGRLAVGTMETTAAVRLPPILARFHADHPEVELTIVPGPSEVMVAEVLAGRVDGAFVAGAVEHAELVSQPAFEEELVLVESATGITAEAGRTTLLAFRRGCAYRARAETAMREAGQVPYRVLEFGSLEAILGCVGAGMGVAVLPRAVVEREPWRGMFTARPLPPEIARMPTRFVRRVDTPETETLRAFLAAVEDGPPAVSAVFASAAQAPTHAAGLIPS